MVCRLDKPRRLHDNLFLWIKKENYKSLVIFKPFQNDFFDPFQNDAEVFEILMMISIKVLFGEKTKG